MREHAMLLAESVVSAVTDVTESPIIEKKHYLDRAEM